MFTGIISHTGKVASFKKSQLTVDAQQSLVKQLKKGSSIAVDGVCLTVIRSGTTPPVILSGAKNLKTKDQEKILRLKPQNDDLESNFFQVELMPETLKRTAFAKVKLGDLVNLELPLSAKAKIEGHFVQGHIDGVGKVKSIKKVKNSHIFQIETSKVINRYIVPKGSITVNGVSLTVIRVGSSNFTVGIIPYTWKNTNFHRLNVGDLVNIEVDILAKYIEKLVKR